MKMNGLYLCLVILFVFCEKSSQNCGKPYQDTEDFSGGNIGAGDFPWMAALMYKSALRPDSKPMYFCGGTLVSANKVVTAAHCIHNKNARKPCLASDLIILLGVNNLENLTEPGRVEATVSSIELHAGWDPKTRKFNDDIALLNLEDDVQFSRYIQPICLLDQLDTFGEGVIIGWGKTELSLANHQNIPTKIKLSIIQSNSECYEKYPSFASIGAENSFCASASAPNVCQGNSGSGLMVQVMDRYFLKGVLSSTVQDTITGCSKEKIGIFTNVAKYSEFINVTGDTSVKGCEDIDQNASDAYIMKFLNSPHIMKQPCSLDPNVFRGLLNTFGSSFTQNVGNTPSSPDVKNIRKAADSLLGCSSYNPEMAEGCWYGDKGREHRGRRAQRCSVPSTWEYNHPIAQGLCYCLSCVPTPA